MLYVTLLKHPKILREPSSVFEDPSWPLKRSNQPSWGGGRLLLGQRLGAQLCQSQQWTKRSCNVFQMRWLSLSLQTPGTPGGLNGMAWWIWLHVKTAKSVWNEIGICMDLWRVSCSNLCTYEEDFRCCFFNGIMLRLRCRSHQVRSQRFPGFPEIRCWGWWNKTSSYAVRSHRPRTGSVYYSEQKSQMLHVREKL